MVMMYKIYSLLHTTFFHTFLSLSFFCSTPVFNVLEERRIYHGGACVFGRSFSIAHSYVVVYTVLFFFRFFSQKFGRGSVVSSNFQDFHLFIKANLLSLSLDWISLKLIFFIEY
jgi:hypothetical protein